MTLRDGTASLLVAILCVTTPVGCGQRGQATERHDAASTSTARDAQRRERIVTRLLDDLDDARLTMGATPADDRDDNEREILGHLPSEPLGEPWVALDGDGRRPRTEPVEGGGLRLLDTACAIVEVAGQQDFAFTAHMAPERLIPAEGQRVAGEPILVELDDAPTSNRTGCRTTFLVHNGLMPRRVEAPPADDEGLRVNEIDFTTMSQTRALAVVLATGLEINYGLHTGVSRQEGATARLGRVSLVRRGIDGLSRERFHEVNPPDPLLGADRRGLRVKPALERVTRDAVIAPPGTSLCWSLGVPDGAALRFATGVAWNQSASPGREVTFRVRCGGDVVFEERRAPESLGWSDHLTRLEGHRGRQDVCFETSAADGDGTIWSLWGTPELTALEPIPDDAPPATIILVSIDTLRADRLGFYGYGPDTSPNLDRLAEGGAVYEDHVAQTGWTLPSHVSMLTGLAPEAHGVTGQMDHILELLEVGFDPTVPTLAAALREAGWSTHAIVSAPYLDPAFGFDRGFDGYDASTISSHLHSHSDVTAPRLTRLARELVATSGSRPLFLFLHYWDVHYDYIPPREDLAAVHPRLAEQPIDYSQVRHPFTRHVDPALIRLVMTADPSRSPPEFYRRIRELLPRFPRVNAFMLLMSGLYDGEIRTVDRHLGMLFDELREQGRGDRVLLVTGDHGESFMEHGTLGHGVDNIYSEGLIVPLLLHAPGRVTAARRDTPSMTIDVVPTILDLAGLSPLSGAQGRSLLRPGDPERLVVGHDGTFSRVQATAGHHRLLVWGPFGPDQLFDLDEDRQMRHDVGDQHPRRRAALRLALARYLLVHGRGLHVAVVGDDRPGGVEITLECDAPLRPAFVYGAPDTGAVGFERDHHVVRLRAAPAAGELVAMTILAPDDAEVRWSVTPSGSETASPCPVLAGNEAHPGTSGVFDERFALAPNLLPDGLGDTAGAVHLWRTAAFSVRAPLTVQEDTIEQLRALGYLRGQGPRNDAPDGG